MKKILLLFISISFFSCQEKFNPNEFKGSWLPFDKNGDYLPTPTIEFKNDSIFFSDIYIFTKGGEFIIRDKQIFIKFLNDSLNEKLLFNRKDSSILLGETKYHFFEGYNTEKITEYELIEYNTNQKIDINLLKRFDAGFHLFKNKLGVVKLKLNDRITNHEDIHSFTFGISPHFDIPIIAIYIGKGVSLKEVVRCYYQLASVNMLKVALITSFDLKENKYNAHIEKIEIWNEQITNHFKDSLEYHEFDINNRSFFVNKYSPKSIIINSSKDFNKIDAIDSKYSYLISISDDLPLADYIYLKERLLEVRKKRETRIRTEIIDFNL
ncbi:MAG: hypothetical protein JXR05_03585 [Flavobacteriaceae bacterium]